MVDDKPQLKPIKRVAKERGLAYSSLRDLAFRGAFPVVKIGSRWYLDDRDIDKMIAARKEKLG